jgi:Ca-activated chloride channel homolog
MKYLQLSIFTFISFVSLAAMSAGTATSYEVLSSNARGVELLKEQSYSEALPYFYRALGESNGSPEIYLNLGISFEGMGQADKAISAYRSAIERAQDQETKFYGYFNLAQLYGKAKKYDEALHFYQQALEIRADSIEVKTNIELLMQQQQQEQKQQGEGGDKKSESGGSGDKQQDQKEGQDKKDKEGNEEKKDEPKKYSNSKPQPKPFKSEELNEGDVRKILGELKNQEQRIRREYYKKDVKERGRDKDW